MPSDKKFYIRTFGCQMNVYDSDKMKDIFLSHNINQTDDFQTADYVVLNTCHIREKATEKTFSDLDEFEILHIAILPNFRNRGFALNLMKELEKLININKKSLKIFLEVSSSNKFAIKLYEKLGYKAYNERKNYYRSKSINAPNSQDAILFAKSLNDIK